MAHKPRVIQALKNYARLARLYDAIVANPGASVEELAEGMSVHINTVYRRVRRLQALGAIAYTPYAKQSSIELTGPRPTPPTLPAPTTREHRLAQQLIRRLDVKMPALVPRAPKRRVLRRPRGEVTSKTELVLVGERWVYRRREE